MCGVRDRVYLRRYERQFEAMRRPEAGMALFGMVWLLRVRAEMKRCSKCQRRQEKQSQQRAFVSKATSFFTIEGAASATSLNATAHTSRTPVPSADGPTTFCEVHGFVMPKEDIQEFYELTLLDENKSVQEKTAETIRIANKWESNDGPIIPSFNHDTASSIITTIGGLDIHSASKENISYIHSSESWNQQPFSAGGMTETTLPSPPRPQSSKNYCTL